MPKIATDDGVHLYYEEAGQGTPILFVHEFAGDYRSWEPQMRFFARRYRCIAYSARGYWPSDVPADVSKYSQERVRKDIVCMLDGLGIEKAHVVGLSMGAFATLHFGMHHASVGVKTRALSLTVAGCGSGAFPTEHDAFKAQSKILGADIDAKGMSFAAATYGHGPARVQFQAKDPRGFAQFVQQFSEHDAVGSANTMRGYQGERHSLYSLTDSIAKIQVPTLVMTGDEDEPCLETSVMLKRAITQSHLAVLPGSGHAINIEEPALFNQLLSEFLAQVEEGRLMKRLDSAKPASIWGPAGDPSLL